MVNLSVIIRKQLATSMLTILATSLSILLACGFLSSYTLLSNWLGNLNTDLEVSLFLKQDVAVDPLALKHKLEQLNDIVKVDYLSSAHALKELTSIKIDDDAMTKLPAILVVQLKNIEAFTYLQQLEEVQYIESDREWLQFSATYGKALKYISHIIAALLLISIIFIMSSSIKLQINQFQRNILIAKLFGAENSYIRRPFLLLGFNFGLLSSIVAISILTIIFYLLALPKPHYQLLIETVVISSALGIISSYLALISTIDKIKLQDVF